MARLLLFDFDGINKTSTNVAMMQEPADVQTANPSLTHQLTDSKAY